MFLSDLFLFFFFLIQIGQNQWSNATKIMRRGNEFKTSLPEMENELPEEWITFAHSHRVERARAANCRRLSVPFQANPIIRNETASFYGLVQAYLFIRYARTKGVGVEMYRGLAIPLPLLILLVDVQGGIHTRTTRSFSLILGPNGSLRFQLFHLRKSHVPSLSLSLSCEIWMMLMCSRIWTLRFVYTKTRSWRYCG